MLARAGDGEQIEQGEIVETEHLDEPRRGALAFIEIEPAIELLLRQARGAVNTADTVTQQSSVVTLGGKGDLVAQVRHAIIDWGG